MSVEFVFCFRFVLVNKPFKSSRWQMKGTVDRSINKNVGCIWTYKFDGDYSDPARHRALSSVGTCLTFSWQTALRCDISTLSFPNSPFLPCRYSGDGAKKSERKKKDKKQNKTERSVWVEHLEHSFRGIIIYSVWRHNRFDLEIIIPFSSRPNCVMKQNHWISLTGFLFSRLWFRSVS